MQSQKILRQVNKMEGAALLLMKEATVLKNMLGDVSTSPTIKRKKVSESVAKVLANREARTY
jgi:hypothetical protein